PTTIPTMMLTASHSPRGARVLSAGGPLLDGSVAAPAWAGEDTWTCSDDWNIGVLSILVVLESPSRQLVCFNPCSYGIHIWAGDRLGAHCLHFKQPGHGILCPGANGGPQSGVKQKTDHPSRPVEAP